jgi:hypothetical protein
MNNLIAVSDVNARTKTNCKGYMVFGLGDKIENINGINKVVWAVNLETGQRILNPDFKVSVAPRFQY